MEKERISVIPQHDLMFLALMKSKVAEAESKMEASQAQHDLALMNFKYQLLSVFNRLGLPEDCKIKDDGTIFYPEEGPIPPLPVESND